MAAIHFIVKISGCVRFAGVTLDNEEVICFCLLRCLLPLIVNLSGSSFVNYAPFCGKKSVFNPCKSVAADAMDEWKDGCMDEWKDGCMDEWVVGFNAAVCRAYSF